MGVSGANRVSRPPRAVALVAGLLGLLAVLGARRAEAAKPLSDTEIEALVADFARRLVEEPGGDGKRTNLRTARLLVQLETGHSALVEVDAACPITGRVSNLAARPLFNVAVKVGERMSKDVDPVESTIHLAYLPPKSQVRVAIACRTSDLGHGVKLISGDGFAPASALTAEGVAAMIAQRSDSALDRRGNYGGAAWATTSVADEVLANVDDEALFLEVVAAFLQVEAGGSAVGRVALQRSPDAAAAWLSKLFPGASPAAATATFEAMVAGGLDLTSPVAKPLLDRLCSSREAEADRAALWTRALSGTLGASPEARAVIVRRCSGSTAQTRARLRAASSSELAAALDGLEGPAFETALELAGGPSPRWEALAGLLRRTDDHSKLAAVLRRHGLADITEPATIRDLVRAVADAEPGQIDSEKASFVGSGLERLHALAPADAAALLGELTGLAASGKIKNATIQSAILERSNLAPEAAKKALEAVVREESLVLEPTWVLAQVDKKSLDPNEFLLFNRKFLGSCGEGGFLLVSCLSRLPEGVPGVGREALRASFVDEANESARGEDDPSTVVALAKAFRGVGLDTAPLVTQLCAGATRATPSEDGAESESEARLAAAAAIDPTAACIGEQRAKLRWDATGATAWAGLRFPLLLLPIALGLLYLRRLWGPVRARLQVADGEVAAGRAAGGGERRFDAGVWSRSMTAGLALLGKKLEDEPSEPLRRVAKVLREVPPASRDQILEKACLAADETIRDGDVRSLLVRLPRALVYAVCFTGRPEQALTVQRHAAFREGWETHAARLREATAAEAPGLPLLAWLFFLHADATTGTLLVALEDGGVSVIPEPLLGGREPRSPGARVSRHHHTFALAGEPTLLPVANRPAAVEG